MTECNRRFLSLVNPVLHCRIILCEFELRDPRRAASLSGQEVLRNGRPSRAVLE